MQQATCARCGRPILRLPITGRWVTVQTSDPACTPIDPKAAKRGGHAPRREHPTAALAARILGVAA